jgi:hypothetical protein
VRLTLISKDPFMAATITGITRLAPIVQGSMTYAAVGPGDAPPANPSTRNGFKGSCLQLGQEVPPTVGYLYTAWQNLSPSSYDISGDDQYMICHFKNEIAGYHQFPTTGALAAEAVAFILFSGGSSTNWAVWYMPYSAELVNGEWHPIILGATAPAATGGTWDDTDVTGYGVGSRVGNTATYTMNSMFQQLIYIDGVPVFGDDSAALTGFQDYIDILLDHATTTFSHQAIKRAGTTYEIGHSFNLTARNFDDSSEAVGIAFMENGLGYSGISDGTFKANFTPPASGTQVLKNYSFASTGNKPDMAIDGAASGSAITLNACLLATMNDVSVTGSGSTLNSVNIPSPSNLTISGADVDLVVTGMTNDIQWTGDLTAGSTIRTDADIDITFAETDLSDIDIILTDSNTITVSPTSGSGTYNLSGLTTSGTVTLDNATANNTTIVLAAGTTNAAASPTAGGGTITVDSPPVTFTINVSETGSLIQIFTTTTQTILDSTTGSSLAFVHSGQTVDYVVQKAGFIPQRFTNIALSGTSSVTVNLVASREYDASHGLTYTTDASWASNQLTVPTFGVTGRGVFSLMIDSFISETALRNTPFNLEMDGANSLFLVNDAEGASDASIQNLVDCGVGYYSTAGTLTAAWAGLNSVGEATGFTGEYQQVDGSGTTDARASGPFRQLIKTYGDASHGNFDYRGHLVAKYQVNGYYQARSNILDAYGISALEQTLYIVSLAPVATGITTGDPAISITITDHTASPITVGGKSYDYEIVDNGTNSAQAILREINYNLSLDATYQGKDPFNYPDMVIESGGSYETSGGQVEGQDTPTTFHGFYVSRSSADHPDFARFQSNDGTYYTPAVVNQATITNLPTDGDDIRLQIYNVTTATEVYSGDPSAATYSDTYTEGTDYTAGDEIRVRFAELNADVSFKSFQTTVTSGSTGWSLNAANFITADAVYATNAVDGSTITKFSYSSADDQFNLTVANNFIAAELFAFYCYTLTTAAGIQGAFGSFVAENAGNYRNVTAIADIYLDNETTASQRQTDAARIYKDDGTYPVLDPTTSGYGIDVNWQNVVYVVSTGGSALTAPQAAQLSTIESRTSGLTYTVTNKVDANIHYVNDIEVDGVGSVGDPWGPA